jgi:hypothetical protein
MAHKQVAALLNETTRLIADVDMADVIRVLPPSSATRSAPPVAKMPGRRACIAAQSKKTASSVDQELRRQ